MLALDLKKVISEAQWNQRDLMFPFKTSLSLAPLIQYWRDLAKNESLLVAKQAQEVIALIEKSPELLAPLNSLEVLEKHKTLIDLLMTPLFPSAFRESDRTAGVLPFSLFPFYVTQSFQNTFLSNDGQFNFQTFQSEESVHKDRTLSAYVSIAARMYGFVVRRPRQRLIYTVVDQTTGLRKYYDFFITTRFIEIITHGQIPKLTDSKKQFLQKNLRSMEAWIKTLPVHHFEFSGFSFIRAIDVTMQEVTTAIKQILIDKDSIPSKRISAHFSTDPVSNCASPFS